MLLKLSLFINSCYDYIKCSSIFKSIKRTVTNMKKRIKSFLFLGFDRETIIRLYDQIDENNVLALMTANCALVMFMCLASIYVTFFLPNIIKSTMCLCMCMSGVINIMILKKTSMHRTHRLIEVMISWVMILCFICGIWMGSFGSEGRLAVSCILIFAIIPVFFISLPFKNIVILLPSVLIFWICSYYTKDKALFLYDLLHSLMGMVGGMGISWSLSHSKITNMISNQKLKETNEALYYNTITDALTGLPNRARTMTVLTNLIEHPTKKFLICMVLDIDHFKEYNDTYGHPEGDALLSCLGELLTKHSRSNKLLLGRIGGEEFMALCEADSEGYGKKQAIRLRQAIQDMTISHKQSNVTHNITVSIGLFVAPTESEIIQKAYILADNALYHAKNNGRNCCWQYKWNKKAFTIVNE